MREDKTLLSAMEVEVRRNSLPIRREFLKILQGRRENLLYELRETEALLQGTLLFETEERDSLQSFTRSVQDSLLHLDSCITHLEESIRIEEEEV